MEYFFKWLVLALLAVSFQVVRADDANSGSDDGAQQIMKCCEEAKAKPKAALNLLIPMLEKIDQGVVDCLLTAVLADKILQPKLAQLQIPLEVMKLMLSVPFVPTEQFGDLRLTHFLKVLSTLFKSGQSETLTCVEALDPMALVDFLTKMLQKMKVMEDDTINSALLCFAPLMG